MDWLKRRAKSATPTAWRVIIGAVASIGAALGFVLLLLPAPPGEAPVYVAGPVVVLLLCVMAAKVKKPTGAPWNLNHCAFLGVMVGVMWMVLLIVFAVSRLA